MINRNEFAARKVVSDAVAIGKKYSATAYPNPSRTECPNAETLKAMARRERRIALREMPIAHIVTCSPCFNEYNRYRRAAIGFRRLQWAAAIVVITAAAVASSRFVHFGTRQSGVVTARRTNSPPAPQLPPTSSAQERRSQIEVNLALFSTTRGNDSEKPQEPIHLPAKAVRVLFLLPTGMEPGAYAVRLQDAGGSAKIQRLVNVAIKDGVASFTLDVDFKPSDAGLGWRLMIRQPGLSWRSYAVTIG